MLRKVFDLKALDVDTSQRKVKFAFAEMSKVDRDGDVFDPKAFTKSIMERGPKGSNEIWHLLDHTQKSFSALSKMEEIGVEGSYLYGVSGYRDTFAWREVAWPLYEAGDFTQHSIGFEPIDIQAQKGYNLIKEARVWEGSAVLWGAQPDTPTMQVVKGILNLEDDRDITAAEKVDEIIKAIKKGRYDKDSSLLIIELKRVQTLFDTKQFRRIVHPSTPPSVDTVPVNDLKDALNKFSQLIKTN